MAMTASVTTGQFSNTQVKIYAIKQGRIRARAKGSASARSPAQVRESIVNNPMTMIGDLTIVKIGNNLVSAVTMVPSLLITPSQMYLNSSIVVVRTVDIQVVGGTLTNVYTATSGTPSRSSSRPRRACLFCRVSIRSAVTVT
jgi:hypothetical protein